MNALGGVDVVMSQVVRDGDAYAVGNRILVIGVRPLTEVEFAREEGRWLVRNGLADVLAWLGESVGPQPRRVGKGQKVLEMMREFA